MDKLASIRAFTKVVQHNGFSAAARDLRLSRSAVSKHVIELEEELGVQLLSRTTRSVTATENGQAYYERCLAILADLEEADLAAARSQAEVRGLLRINAPMSFGTLHLARAVADFMEKYPELRIQLVLSDQQIDSVQEGYDMTLRIADLPSSSMIARKIAPAHRAVCATWDSEASERFARARVSDLRPSCHRQPVEAHRPGWRPLDCDPLDAVHQQCRGAEGRGGARARHRSPAHLHRRS
jgi:DNA-binding transcriptional LysR family regulator